MPKQLTLKNNLDDAMLKVELKDFSGGLNSEIDPYDLPLTSSADCQNVNFSKLGRILGRAGFANKITGLAGTPDGLAFFYDAGGARRIVLWAAGNVYDVSNLSSATLVASATYTAGERIAWTVLNSILYYSDGLIPLRQWDATTSTEQAVANSGGAGVIAPPAAKVLATYAGSIIAGNTNIAGFAEPHAVRWCVVNDPTTWFGTDIQEVGAGQGGEVNALTSVGVSSVGVSPYRAIFVGKSRQGVFVLKGALGTLEEVLVNAPTGVLDGLTVKFLPGPDGSGYILWLGTDYKVWATNGVTTQEMSGPIRTELHDYVESIVANVSKPIFSAVDNGDEFQYILDVGNGRQYPFDYNRQIWTRYQGWPSGYSVSARSTNGTQLILCADRASTRLVQLNTGTSDNGADIAPYYKTGFITADDPEMYKVWKWVYLTFVTDNKVIGGNVVADRLGGDKASFSFTPDKDTSSGSAVWDVSLWDSLTQLWGNVYESALGTSLLTYKKKARLIVSVFSFFGPNYGLSPPTPESLRGYAVQLTIAPGGPIDGHFEVLGAALLFIPRGRKRVDQ